VAQAGLLGCLGNFGRVALECAFDLPEIVAFSCEFHALKIAGFVPGKTKI
jgi:hypothetical protein